MALTTIQDEMLSESSPACKAWVHFNGTGTVAISQSYNVSSITDNGTGTYTVNFTDPMPSTNYAVAGMAWATGISNAADLKAESTTGTSATSCNIRCQNAGTPYDGAVITFMAFAN